MSLRLTESTAHNPLDIKPRLVISPHDFSQAVENTSTLLYFGHQEGAGGIATFVDLYPAGHGEVIAAVGNSGGEINLEVFIILLPVNFAVRQVICRQLHRSVDGAPGRKYIMRLAQGCSLFGVKEPAVSRNAYRQCPDDLIIGDQFGDMVSRLIVDIREGIVLLVYFNSPVPVPGLLDKKAVGIYIIDIVFEDDGIGKVIPGDFDNGKLRCFGIGAPRFADPDHGQQAQGGQQQDTGDKEEAS
jgi:hypothetical protein